MSNSEKILDPAFQGVGQRLGTEIWRIENFHPISLEKSEHGKFYSGDSYIVLRTGAGRGGAFLYDIHYWIGKDTSQDEAGTAAIKTVELDAALGSRAIQHRELQGFESDKFLSYFKPCIIPLEGGVASGFRKPEEEKFETRLYICKGNRIARVKQVPFARSSLNHDDVFILDTEKKIYQFNGANSSIQERGKGLEVIQHLKDKYHNGVCDVAIVDDGKFEAESDTGDFWVLVGGFAPIGRKAAAEDDKTLDRTTGTLYRIDDGQLKMEEGTISKEMLENSKCYLLDCGAEVFLWVGRITQVEDRKAATQVIEEFIKNQSRPKTTRTTRVIQGFETQSFKSNFSSWPIGAGTAGGEEGRGKVAAMLKQQGVGVKGGARGTPVNEDIPPLLQDGGKLEVWCINGSAKTPVPTEDVGKFYSGDCYIILYTYHSGDKKEEYFLSSWTGKDSTQEDQLMAMRLLNTTWNSMKGRPVQGRIIQGKEPPQFIALFQPMVVLKGGMSSSYTADGIALIKVSNTLIHNNKAIQVDAVATSLSLTDCFLLQSGSTLFIWHGNSSTFEQQDWSAKVAEFLKPGVALKHLKEGTESSAFWLALGGKQSYTSKQKAPLVDRDPHLYTFSMDKGKFEVSEVFNFSQDDLLPEDILILDTHAEVFVWVGQSVAPKEKQKAFDVGLKYIESAVISENLSPDAPLYKIMEGNEPYFFTTYFSWDSVKAAMPGNSFTKKFSLLFGASVHGSKSPENINKWSRGGATQRASALAALTSAFNPTSSRSLAPKPVRAGQGSQRAAAVSALINVLTAESPTIFSRSPSPVIDRSKSADPTSTVEGYQEAVAEKGIIEYGAKNNSDASVGEVSAEDSLTIDKEGACIFSYERLKAKSANPVKGIDYKRREAYLSDEEFLSVLGMPKDKFYKQPQWKQDMQKRKVDLF